MIFEKTGVNDKIYTLDTIRFQFLVRLLGVFVALTMMLLSDYPFYLGLNSLTAVLFTMYTFFARYSKYRENTLFQKCNLYVDVVIITILIGLRGGLRSDFYLGYYIVLGYVLLIRDKKLIRNISFHIIGFYTVVILLTSENFSLERLIIRCVMMTLTMICLYMYSKLLSQETDKRLKISEIALRDRLTGLYNRHIIDSIDHILLGKRAYILLDIDDFKLINDKYGHIKGDEVLKDLGSLILQTLEGDEIAIRYGGEEFLLILEGEQKAVLDRMVILAKQFSALKYDFLDHKLTFSAGLYITDHACSFEQALKETDRKLYQAKESGKNQVV